MEFRNRRIQAHLVANHAQKDAEEFEAWIRPFGGEVKVTQTEVINQNRATIIEYRHESELDWNPLAVLGYVIFDPAKPHSFDFLPKPIFERIYEPVD